MHFIPDTSEEDFSLEIFWKEDYKKIFSNDIGKIFKEKMESMESFKNKKIEKKNFEKYLENICNFLIISLENGSDEAFDIIYESFREKKKIPKRNKYSNVLWPEIFTDEILQKFETSIFEEYSNEISYKEEYKEHYSYFYSSYNEFIFEISKLVINSTFNAGEDAKAEIFTAMILKFPPPKGRRKAKRLKGW